MKNVYNHASRPIKGNQLCIVSMCESHSCPCIDAETRQLTLQNSESSCSLCQSFMTYVTPTFLEMHFCRKLDSVQRKLCVLHLFLNTGIKNTYRQTVTSTPEARHGSSKHQKCMLQKSLEMYTPTHLNKHQAPGIFRPPLRMALRPQMQSFPIKMTRIFRSSPL